MDIKRQCVECGDTDFFKEDGFYYCTACLTQVQGWTEQVYDEIYNSKVRVTKRKIKKQKTADDEPTGFTTWEMFNFALIGLVDELIALGASPSIKLTALQLWATYLQKHEVAFVSTTQKVVPKLGYKYKFKDEAIIYGKRKVKKKKTAVKSQPLSDASSGTTDITARTITKRKNRYAKSELEASEATSGSEIGDLSSVASSRYGAIRKYSRIALNIIKKTKKKKVSRYLKRRKRDYSIAQFKDSFEVMSQSILLTIIYIALRLHDQNIFLSDLLRFAREGHLSFYKLYELLADYDIMSCAEDKLTFACCIKKSYTKYRHQLTKSLIFLGVEYFAMPDMECLIERHCIELQLPRGIMLYAKRLLALTKPKLLLKDGRYVPNYEGRAMGFIIVTLKILFALDGITEYKISDLAEEINRRASDKNVLDSTLFSFREWQWYIEGRRTILMALHLPTKVKYEPDNQEYPHLQKQFYETMKPKVPELIKNRFPVNTSYNMWLDQMSSLLPPKVEEVFPPSFTPMHSYLQQILANPKYSIPDILRVNFMDTKVGFTTKPKKLIDLAAQCNIKVKVVDSNLHYMEKMVSYDAASYFEHDRFTKTEDVEVIENNYKKNPENFQEFVQRGQPTAITIDHDKQNLHDSQNPVETQGHTDANDDFCFDALNSNGQLLIPKGDDDSCISVNSDSEEESFEIAPEEVLFSEEKENLKDKLPVCVLRVKPRFVTYIRDKETGNFDYAAPFHLDQLPTRMRNRLQMLVEKSEGKKELLVKNAMDCYDDIPDSDTNDDNSCAFEPDGSQEDCKDDTEIRTLFRPYKHYWSYRFLSINSDKYERILGKEFPHSFAWLLTECAKITEMSEHELYREILIVEHYMSLALKYKQKSYKRLHLGIPRKVYYNW